MVRTLAVTTNIGCKNMCSYCPQTKFISAYMHRDNKVRQMSFDTFKRCADKMPPGSYMNFAGYSEPCLNPEYVKMIQYANQIGIKIQLLTTAIGMKEEDIEQLEEIPFVRFLVHLPEDQKQTSMVVNKEYIRVIRRLIKSSIRTEWKFHQTRFGNEDLHPLLKISFVEAGLYDAVVKTELKTRAGNIEIQGKSFVKKIKGKISGCGLLYVNQLVPNGDVFICCMDWQLKYCLGNLLELEFDELFQGETYQNILKGFEDDSSEILCRYCELCELA